MATGFQIDIQELDSVFFPILSDLNVELVSAYNNIDTLKNSLPEDFPGLDIVSFGKSDVETITTGARTLGDKVEDKIEQVRQIELKGETFSGNQFVDWKTGNEETTYLSDDYYSKVTGATMANGAISLFAGVMDFGEAIVDTGVVAMTGLNSIMTGSFDVLKGVFTGDWSFSSTKDLWDKRKELVSKNYTQSALDSFYSTKAGKILDEYAIDGMKSTGGGFNTVRMIGKTAGVVGTTILTGGVSSLSLGLVGGASAFGSTVQDEWNKNSILISDEFGVNNEVSINYEKFSEIESLKIGQSTTINQTYLDENGVRQNAEYLVVSNGDGTYKVTDHKGHVLSSNTLNESKTMKGVGNATLRGALEGTVWAAGGKIGNASFGKTAISGVKDNLLIHGGRTMMSTALGGATVPMDALYDSVANNKNLAQAWDDAGGGEAVVTRAVTAFVLSGLTESVGFAKDAGGYRPITSSVVTQNADDTGIAVIQNADDAGKALTDKIDDVTSSFDDTVGSSSTSNASSTPKPETIKDINGNDIPRPKDMAELNSLYNKKNPSQGKISAKTYRELAKELHPDKIDGAVRRASDTVINNADETVNATVNRTVDSGTIKNTTSTVSGDSGVNKTIVNSTDDIVNKVDDIVQNADDSLRNNSDYQAALKEYDDAQFKAEQEQAKLTDMTANNGQNGTYTTEEINAQRQVVTNSWDEVGQVGQKIENVTRSITVQNADDVLNAATNNVDDGVNIVKTSNGNSATEEIATSHTQMAEQASTSNVGLVNVKDNPTGLNVVTSNRPNFGTNTEGTNVAGSNITSTVKPEAMVAGSMASQRTEDVDRLTPWGSDTVENPSETIPVIPNDGSSTEEIVPPTENIGGDDGSVGNVGGVPNGDTGDNNIGNNGESGVSNPSGSGNNGGYYNPNGSTGTGGGSGSGGHGGGSYGSNGSNGNNNTTGLENNNSNLDNNNAANNITNNYYHSNDGQSSNYANGNGANQSYNTNSFNVTDSYNTNDSHDIIDSYNNTTNNYYYPENENNQGTENPDNKNILGNVIAGAAILGGLGLSGKAVYDTAKKKDKKKRNSSDDSDWY